MQIVVKNAPNAAQLYADLGPEPVDFLSIHGNSDLAADSLRAPEWAGQVHGATSCLGAMSSAGRTDGLAAFAIRDPDGAYGTALATVTTDMRAAARQATEEALARADRIGELPDLVWVAATPGSEEDALAGIEDVVGGDVPIIGGSAADNSVEGNWYIFDGQTHLSTGIVVSVLFPSEPVSFAYQNGYAPTENRGIVTKTDGRQVQEIDDRPAMQVYSDWTGGAVPQAGDATGPQAILSESTLWPLGRKIGALGEVPFYLLAHPAMAHGNGAMDLFATVEQGEELTLMNGTKLGLVDRAGRVAALARQNSATPTEPPKGALMIYCGGCMLSVQDQLGGVVDGVASALGGAPFLGAFTFGEQGALIRGGNRHGNLMISCIVFG